MSEALSKSELEEHRKLLNDCAFVRPLGQTAVFYAPSAKVRDPEYAADGRTPHELIEEFFLKQFGGLTHERSNIQGRWRSERGDKTIVDHHDRYEVSFAGKWETATFVEFLADLCEMLEEDSIYLTVGNSAWLVTPRAKEEEEEEDRSKPGTNGDVDGSVK